MTTIKAHLSGSELEAGYKGVADPIAKSHFHVMSLGYEVDEVAELLSFSPRWVRALIKHYNESGAEARWHLDPSRQRIGREDCRLRSVVDALIAEQ